ncbi:unnamed protein product [Cuscuta epithymum]|nr:unnamed protein product [Cuscuta epithymum]CAH9130722.1 unnamed protein product [Cuscuta epithymum]
MFLKGLPGLYKKENIKMKIDKKKRIVSVVGESQEENTKYKDVWLRFQRDFPIPEDCDMEKIIYDDRSDQFIIVHMPIIPKQMEKSKSIDDDDQLNTTSSSNESQRKASMPPQEPDHGNEFTTPKTTTNNDVRGGIVHPEHPDTPTRHNDGNDVQGGIVHSERPNTPARHNDGNDVQGGISEGVQQKQPPLKTTLLMNAFIGLLVVHELVAQIYDHIVWMIYKKLD